MSSENTPSSHGPALKISYSGPAEHTGMCVFSICPFTKPLQKDREIQRRGRVSGANPLVTLRDIRTSKSKN